MSELRQIIEQEIRERGPIPFSRYMELCLYHPEFGYYCRNAEQFGKAGDFYTSSDVHAVFGRLMARQFEEMWRAMGSPAAITVKELGPGRGLFARDVLDWSRKKFPDFFRALRYVLSEKSAALREKLAVTLRQHLDDGKAVVEDRESETAKAISDGNETGASKSLPLPSIVFANEVFDALPVEIVGSEGSLRIDERGGRFLETWVQASYEEIEFLDRYSVHPQAGERIEVPMPSMRRMVQSMHLQQGFAITIDYGYTREEQLAGRHRGTLKAIRQHSVSASPYEAPGEQDITADVNFTALASLLEERGVLPRKLITQSQFLMGIGEANQFADAFEDCRLPQERTKVALQLKHLVTPAGMGESFHVLVARKGIDDERVQQLRGLSFGRDQD